MIVSLEAQGNNAYNRYAICPAGNNNKDEDNCPKTLNDKNNNVVFFFVSDLEIMYSNNY